MQSSVADPPLVLHARRELRLAGLSGSDVDGCIVTRSVLGVLRALSGSHSPDSIEATMALAGRLARREHLTPITCDPGTWLQRSSGTKPLWQSARNPAVFSKDGGLTWYHLRRPDETHVSESA